MKLSKIILYVQNKKISIKIYIKIINLNVRLLSFTHYMILKYNSTKFLTKNFSIFSEYFFILKDD
jgi:hypothetical protein